jgi:hypothetical protein
VENLQIDLSRLGKWAFENEMIINPAKSRAVCVTKAQVTESLNYSLGVISFPNANSCIYSGNILSSNFGWADQVNYTVKKAWKSLHFTIRILKKGNSNTKSLAYTSLIRSILEYVSSCWDPYREGQINALDRVQNKVAKCAHQRNDLNWETLVQRLKIARIYVLFKAYTGERAWKAISDRLQKPCYLSRVDHERKIRSRKQRTDVGNIPFQNRAIQLWNQLPAGALGTLSCKSSSFRKKVRKVIHQAK